MASGLLGENDPIETWLSNLFGLAPDVSVTSWEVDLEDAYGQAQAYIWTTADAQGWGDDDTYAALGYVDAAYKAAGGDVGAFWARLDSTWPGNSALAGWDVLGEAWGSATAGADEATKIALTGSPIPSWVPFAAVGAVALGLVLWLRR